MFDFVCSRSTISKYLREQDLSWQKTKKILCKANTEQTAAYLEDFKVFFEEMRFGKRTLIYIDELRIHQDLDLGYGWNERGQPFRIPSTSPGLHKEINWYGAYDFTNGETFIWSYPVCNGENTSDFLERVAKWLEGRPKPTIIWDGSPVHRAKVAQEKAKQLGLEIKQLPAHSPDLNPIERLWTWMREEVTNGNCHQTLRELFDNCREFIKRVNRKPLALIQRLWPRFELDPEEEKLRISKQTQFSSSLPGSVSAGVPRIGLRIAPRLRQRAEVEPGVEKGAVAEAGP